MTHICVIKLTIIGSDNYLSPGRRQAIIWTSAGLLLIGILGTNFREILSKIHTFSFKKIRLKTSSAKCRGLNELTYIHCAVFRRHIWLIWKNKMYIKYLVAIKHIFITGCGNIGIIVCGVIVFFIWHFQRLWVVLYNNTVNVQAFVNSSNQRMIRQGILCIYHTLLHWKYTMGVMCFLT